MFLVTFAPGAAHCDMAEAQRALERGEYETAFRVLLPLAEQGNREAQAWIGELYRNGHGVALSYPDAILWFRRAALQGEPRAQSVLAVMHANGQGVTKDYAEAFRWAQLSAAQRHAPAQAIVGQFYERGIVVPRNLLKAYMWYDLAIRNARGREQVDPINESRQRVARLLSPADIARARQMASEWTPSQPSGVPGPGATAQPPSAAPPPTAVPQESQRPAATKSTGSGFVVSRSGHVLTNDHVIRDCRELRIAGTGDVLTPAGVVARDRRNDLALLKGPAPATAWAVFRAGRAIRAGEAVIAVGYPLRGLLASTVHVTTGTVSALAGTSNDSRILETTAPVQAGNSGGPLLDEHGHVVGVVMGKLDALKVARLTGDLPQNVGFALTASIARSFMDAHGVEYDTAASTDVLSPADVADQARRFTVAIECAR